MSNPRRTTGRATKRRNADPVRVLRDNRVVYYPSGIVGQGERKFVRCDSAAAAEEVATARRAELMRQHLHGPAASAPLHQVMVAMLRQLKAAGVSEGSIKKYRTNWNKWIPEEIRLTPCHELNISHWSQIFDQLNEKHAGPTVVKSVANTLGKLINWGADREYFLTDDAFGSPVRRGKRYKTAVASATTADLARKAAKAGCKPEDLAATRIELAHCPDWDDVEKYANAFEEVYPGYGYRLVLMAYATGIREAELLALQVEHVVRTAEESKIRVLWQLDRYGVWPARSLPKHNKVRTTIIWDAFTDVVDSLVEDARARDDDTRGYLFPPMTRKSWPDDLTHLATAVKKSVGWKWDFHWLRHAFASHSLTSTDAGGYGLDAALVAEWLGHADPSTTLKMYLVKPKDSNKLAKLMTGRHPREGGPHHARRDR